MFIRFYSGQIDEDSQVAAGLFCAAYDLIEEAKLPDHDYAELTELMRWFRLHLKGPFEHRLRKPWRAQHSICWFKSHALGWGIAGAILVTLILGVVKIIEIWRWIKTR